MFSCLGKLADQNKQGNEEKINNIRDLLYNLEGHGKEKGVVLDNRLYACLLTNAFHMSVRNLYSVWHTGIIKLDDKDPAYTQYLGEYYSELGKTYATLKGEKERFFVYDAPNITTCEIPDEIKEKHRSWNFENIYLVSDLLFKQAQNNSSSNAAFDDFILVEFKNGQSYLLGKDKETMRIRFTTDDDVITSIKNFLGRLKSVSNTVWLR
jgi:hypothetical protein